MPWPLHGGVQLRVFHLFKRIARHHDVTLGCHAWGEEDRDYAAELSNYGIQTVTGFPQAANWRNPLPAVGCALTGRPPMLAQFQSPAIRDFLKSANFDIVQVEETLLAPYVTSLPRGSRARTVLTFHNIHAVQVRRIAEIEPPGFRRLWMRGNALAMQRYEPAMAARFHRAITVSETDRGLLRAANPALAVDVVANGVDTEELTVLPEPAVTRAILFVGTLSYRPCVDAAVWLVREILPILRQHLPGIEVWIVGRSAPAEVTDLAGDGVYVESPVADVVPYYRRATVAVAPLRAGGGSRLKILEAMSLGRAVVSTTVGAEGLQVEDGKNIVIADGAEPFARAIAHLLVDAEFRAGVVRKARRLVENDYGWDALADKQLRIYEELRGEPVRGGVRDRLGP